MSFLSVFLFYGCICILELEVIMVYLKVSFDLYVPRVFSMMRLYLMPADLWLHSLVYQQGLTRESVWVGIPHWASLWYKPGFLKEPQNVKESTGRLFGTLQVPQRRSSTILPVCCELHRQGLPLTRGL